MSKSKLPKSLRKHIRQEKARIRRKIFDPEKQNEAIKKIYEKIKINYNQKVVKK